MIREKPKPQTGPAGCTVRAFWYQLLLLIFVHNSSGSSARGVLKGFILAESQPIGVFHQAGVGAFDDFPMHSSSAAPINFRISFCSPSDFSKDTFLCPNDHIIVTNGTSRLSPMKKVWCEDHTCNNLLILCPKRLPIFA